MTVGIGAICSSEEDPSVIVAADRMVTVGQSGGVEYEDTSAKIEPIIQTDQLSAAMVGSGSSVMIDSIADTARQLAAANNVVEAEGARELMLTAYKHHVQETISNNVLSPLGYELEDLKDDEIEIPVEVQRIVLEQSMEYKNKFSDQVQILLAVTSQSKSRLYLIAGNDYTDFTDIGYGVIGSGTQSARLTFIRREYDSACDFPECIFTVVEAKSQAEERQGVGQDMDMIEVTQAGIREFDEGEITDLRGKLDDIKEAESEARENVITNWDTT
ncbi:hypothetical protein [Halorubrum tropicale]|uniref:hypothetical protein n=1 Tax=Halorubrum tropicale TaxID=1765655 RepID=UPI000A8D6080|nr:hypothetical protein [Halorubrum tropicale]